MDQSILNDMAICIVAAWIVAVGAKVFKQPLILAYLVAGYLIGPSGPLKLIQNEATIQTISELGLILLLFMIGLEIDLKKILGSGRLITVTSITQMFGGCLLGLFFFWCAGFSLGHSGLDALYLAVATVLSSTVIAVKLLYDKREMDTLPGRITLGVLVLQDVLAILFLAIQPNLNHPELLIIAKSLLKALLLVGIAFAVSRFALPAIFQTVARLPELILVGALAWCFLIAGTAKGLGLSPEMGALIAGVAISTFPYTLDVTAKVTSLRDFFVILFFVALGMSIPTPSWFHIKWAIIVSLFVLASRFVTVALPMLKMQNGHRASIISAINLSQISEFSLVILKLGFDSSHIDKETVGIISYSFVFLAVGSTYLISNSEYVMRWVSRWLSDFNVRDLDEATVFLMAPKPKARIFLLGFSWAASSLLEEIQTQAPELLKSLAVVDFNPEVNERLHARGIYAKYGDISQRDTLIHAGVGEAEIIVCSLPNSILRGVNNQKLTRMLREISPEAKIIVHAEFFADVPALYAAGADYVSVPRLIEAADLFNVIKATRNHLLSELRSEQEKELKFRQEIIP